MYHMPFTICAQHNLVACILEVVLLTCFMLQNKKFRRLVNWGVEYKAVEPLFGPGALATLD